MNSRSVTGVNFARQLAEHRRETQQPPTKRFRSSAAPKGTKLPSGYQDRAQLRQQESGDKDVHEDGNLAQRIAALEELVKKGDIDQATFDKLRVEMGVGGDVKSTHVVKGLDWELLRRAKAGEDVNTASEREVTEEQRVDTEKERGEEQEEVDFDAEFEKVTEQKGQEEVVSTAPKEKKEKKGTMAPPPAPAQQQKKSRNEILQQLKASRAAAAAAAEQPPPPPEPALGSKFKKLGDSKPEKKRWVEQDENGRRREALLVTDAQGNTKRKMRWLDKQGEASGLMMPDKDAKPLGMDVPAEIASKAAAATAPEDDDEDIFEGVGDYNPLADIGDDDASSDEDEEGQVVEPGLKKPAPTEPSTQPSTQPSTTTDQPAQPSRPRNYFATSAADDEATAAEEDHARTNPLTRDPNLLAAFKRAAALRQTSPSAEAEGEKQDSGRGQRFLEEVRRREAQDAMDMDLGFGGSRIGDEEDEEPVALEGEQRGGQKRKRGPKKRKGDKESASDVMRVLEDRK